MISVLYVDDDPDTRGRVKFFLEAGGEVSVLTADSADGAHVLLVDQRFDVIVSDYQMSGTDGIAFLKQIRAAGNEIPFILFAERSREEAVIEAFNSGAQFYLLKEGDQEECFSTLSLRIRQAVRRRGGHEDLENSLPLPFLRSI